MAFHPPGFLLLSFDLVIGKSVIFCLSGESSVVGGDEEEIGKHVVIHQAPSQEECLNLFLLFSFPSIFFLDNNFFFVCVKFDNNNLLFSTCSYACAHAHLFIVWRKGWTPTR